MPVKVDPNSPSAGSRRRMSGEERRQQILDVALDLFARDGFRGTTTKAIAAAAGVNEAIIFRHFETKEELYTAILEYRATKSGRVEWEAALRECANRADDEGLLRLLISKIFEAYRADPGFYRLMLYASLEGHELAKISDQKIGMPVYHFLCEYVAKRQRQGAFRPGEPGLMVFAAAGVAVQYATTTFLLQRPLLESSDEQVASAFAALLVNGFRNPVTGGNTDEK